MPKLFLRVIRKPESSRSLRCVPGGARHKRALVKFCPYVEFGGGRNYRTRGVCLKEMHPLSGTL